MESRQEGNTIFVTLSDGEDLFPSLETVAREHRLESGSVLWGIGMMQDFEIGFFRPSGYEKTSFSDRHELLGLHGSLAMRADPKIHLHATVGRPDHSAIGGHLFRAKAAVVNEIQIARFEAIRFNRRFDEKTGLRELVFD
ncbi:MAG: PPC domain-containing DNA-binding protein [Thermoplasmata archaeon]